VSKNEIGNGNTFVKVSAGDGIHFSAALLKREQISHSAQVSNVQLLLFFLAVVYACLFAHSRANIEHANVR